MTVSTIEEYTERLYELASMNIATPPGVAALAIELLGTGCVVESDTLRQTAMPVLLERPTKERPGYRLLLRKGLRPQAAKALDEDEDDTSEVWRALVSECIAGAIVDWAIATGVVPALDADDRSRLGYSILLPLPALEGYLAEGLDHAQIARLHNCSREVVHEGLHVLRDPVRALEGSLRGPAVVDRAARAGGDGKRGDAPGPRKTSGAGEVVRLRVVQSS